ncbi:sulfurtransferase [Saccharopolyspora sp. ASAGF58]|uniref:sulfurtransferase n=1 Tax=Saccharopolyspora sp. ASAGF58 TaxID=2719023 RepID=UPI00143FDBA0|nr:sulfurtransferase [Saccharopolyspora sp. ASAGF58]QIZ36715.1 sulfurtransferase [Saccharopolyspora sp. ASAGF58]
MHPLISTDDLMVELHRESPPTLLDIRWSLQGPPGRESYDAGHLPGAVFVDLDTELAAEPGPAGRHPLPDPGDLEAALRRAGVDGDRPVVVYDADNGSVAARAWWLLRWAGHESVAVLDGGYAAWGKEGRPTTTDVPHPTEGGFRVRPGSMPVVDADAAAQLAREGTLLDARAPERYRGDVEPVDPRAGHIPGARNAPFAAHMGDSGRWRSPEELAKHFADLGVDTEGPVGAYCGSGVTACSVLLALEHAGVSGPQRPAVLYAGSWSNWSVDPARPAATGSEAG